MFVPVEKKALCRAAEGVVTRVNTRVLQLPVYGKSASYGDNDVY